MADNNTTLSTLWRFWDRMMGEYQTLGLHPEGHLMAHLRKQLPANVLSSDALQAMEDGAYVRVAGLVIRRQRPLAKAVFLTLEDEHGHILLIVWPGTYERCRHVLKSPLLVVAGTVTRRDGTLNVVLETAQAIETDDHALPRSKDWG
ncbi:MAG: OB-fold nucleic acid binding domain-containing protein [Dehalococcoidia bacterium]